jgi:hypothetical protein
MKRLIIAAATVAVLALSPLAVGAFAAADDSQEHGRHHWMEERAALLDARLAGFKATLKLNSDQEKSWGLFENAVRDGAKARAENMRAMRERRESDEEPSPIDRMRMMSDRLAKRSAAVKSLADAATPLYVSLDDGQKRDFGLLFRDLVHRGRHHHG